MDQVQDAIKQYSSTEERDGTRQMAFSHFLRCLQQELVRYQAPNRPVCFISYAWEQDPKENSELQTELQQLQSDLQALQIEVLLDIKDMNGVMKTFMVEGIARSDYVLLIGTPRFKERASQPETNLALELKHALRKPLDRLVPLLYRGTRNSAFPECLHDLLIRDFSVSGNYYHLMTQLQGPVGLIPSLLNLRNDRHYIALVDHFASDLKLIQSNLLTVKDLNRRSMQLESTMLVSVHNGGLRDSGSFSPNSALDATAPITPVPPRQQINTTFGDSAKIGKGAQVKFGNLVVTGSEYDLQGQDQEFVSVVQVGQKSLIEGDKTSSAFNKLDAGEGSKLEVGNSTVTGVKWNMRKTEILLAPGSGQPAAYRGGSTAPKGPLTPPLSSKDRELVSEVKELLSQKLSAPVYEDQIAYREQVLEALKNFSLEADRNAARQSLQDTHEFLKTYD
jgi:hypothetical protein